MDGRDIRIKHLEEKSAQSDVRKIFAHVLEMVLPEPALRRYVKLNNKKNVLTVADRKYYLDKYEQVIVVGGGKAAKRTGAELVNILDNRITTGILNVFWTRPWSRSQRGLNSLRLTILPRIRLDSRERGK